MAGCNERKVSIQTITPIQTQTDFLSSDFSSVFFWSPKMDFAGQILKAGHFWQPTATAIGHKVMEFSSEHKVK